MAMGRDIYLDSGLQIKQLDALGSTKLAAYKPSIEQKAIEHLVSKYVCKVVFWNSTHLLPLQSAFLSDPAFIADRKKLLGMDFRELVEKRRPSAIVEFKSVFSFLEDTLLSDGRKWLANTAYPTPVDIEAIWPIVWLDAFEGALPDEDFSAARYPLVRAWLERFKDAERDAEQALSPIEEINGQEAADIITSASATNQDVPFDNTDAVVQAKKLNKGDTIRFWANDVADQSQRDVGVVVGLDQQQMVIDMAAIRVHVPRTGFAFEKTINS